MGSTFDAIQIAQSCRDYLDNLGHFKVQIVLMTTDKPDIRKTLGLQVEKIIKK